MYRIVEIQDYTILFNILLSPLLFSVPFHHPTFLNVDNYAEKCLASVARKMRNNYRNLQALFRYLNSRYWQIAL